MKYKYSNKVKSQKSITIALAVLNVVNNMLPLAALYPNIIREVAWKAQADSLPINLVRDGGQLLDGIFFGRAEAYTNPVLGSVYNELVDGEQNVLPTGATFNTSITATGVQNISGGTASVTVINGGSQLIVNGGLAASTVIDANGSQTVGALAIDTTINQGVQTVGVGGTASNTTVIVGAQIVSGFADHTTVRSAQDVAVGGTAINTVLESGGNQFVNGLADKTIVSRGIQNVNSGGTGKNTTITSVGVQTLDGIADGTIINGGVQGVNVTGSATNTIVNGGGLQAVAGVAEKTTVNSGIQTIVAGGSVLDTVVNDGGLQRVSAGATVVSTVLYRGGSQIINSGVVADANTVIFSGGTQTILAGGSAVGLDIGSGRQEIAAGASVDKIRLTNAVQIVDGTATATVINKAAVQNINAGGLATDTIVDAAGKQNINSGGVAKGTIINFVGRVYVADGAALQNATVNKDGNLILVGGARVGGYLENKGYVEVTEFDVGSIDLLRGSGGALLFNAQPTLLPTYAKRVNIGSLEGSQTLVISADLKNNTADMIVVSGDAGGRHFVKVTKEASLGSELSGIKGAANIAQILGVDSSQFFGQASNIDGVKILPTIVHNGNFWQITDYKRLGSSNLANVAAAGADMSYAALYSTDQVLKSRMVYLQDAAKEGGVWAKLSGGELSVNSNSLKHTAIQGGYDQVHKTSRGTSITGIVFEHLDGSGAYTEKGSGKLKNTGVGLYHTWLGNSGQYYDIVLKAGRLSNELKAQEFEPISGNYHTWNTALSVEYGYKKQMKAGVYITPFAKLSVGRINSANYIADSGTAIYQEAINSLRGRLGLVIGQNTERSNWYFDAALVHEFSAKSRTTTGSGLFASTIENDLKGTGVELTMGSNIRVSNAGVLYTDISRSFGGKLVNKWQLQAGYRYNF